MHNVSGNKRKITPRRLQDQGRRGDCDQYQTSSGKEPKAPVTLNILTLLLEGH